MERSGVFYCECIGAVQDRLRLFVHLTVENGDIGPQWRDALVFGRIRCGRIVIAVIPLANPTSVTVRDGTVSLPDDYAAEAFESGDEEDAVGVRESEKVNLILQFGWE